MNRPDNDDNHESLEVIEIIYFSKKDILKLILQEDD